MVKVIQDLWIMRKDGVMLFSRVFHQKMEDQLFGALMSALDSFAKELSDGGLSSFELSNIRFTIIKKRNFIFIGNASKKIKEKKIFDELKYISEKFFETYSEEFFEKWDQDISPFRNFDEIIDKALENPVKKFWNGF